MKETPEISEAARGGVLGDGVGVTVFGVGFGTTGFGTMAFGDGLGTAVFEVDGGRYGGGVGGRAVLAPPGVTGRVVARGRDVRAAGRLNFGGGGTAVGALTAMVTADLRLAAPLREMLVRGWGGMKGRSLAFDVDFPPTSDAVTRRGRSRPDPFEPALPFM